MTDSDPKDELYTHFVRAYTRHEPALRGFVRSLLPTWDDTDEVMGEVSLVLWKKFETFDPETEFMRWAAVVARFEVLKYRRSKARNRLVFDEDVIKLLADDCAETLEIHNDERRALRSCLGKLPEHQRAMLMRVYTPGVTIKQMAEEIGKTPTAVYKLLARQRKSLYRCVSRSLNRAGVMVEPS
ncbi:MAG: sigma-70 family RNA polymerase sigma factor [Planctomycetota bacterium]